MKIDIREHVNEKIKVITFADHLGGERISQIRNIDGDIYIENGCSEGDFYFEIEDIDNLIKALKKAKELWG